MRRADWGGGGEAFATLISHAPTALCTPSIYHTPMFEGIGAVSVAVHAASALIVRQYKEHSTR